MVENNDKIHAEQLRIIKKIFSNSKSGLYISTKNYLSALLDMIDSRDMEIKVLKKIIKVKDHRIKELS